MDKNGIITTNIYAKLNSILEMLILLEEDFEEQITKIKEKPNLQDGIKLVRCSASIRELRLDAQRLALQHNVGEWWAKRNNEIIKQLEEKVRDNDQ